VKLKTAETSFIKANIKNKNCLKSIKFGGKMKQLTIAIIITSILLLAVFAVAGYISAQQPAKTTGSCSGCNNQCTAESSCEKIGCTAKETGTCNCIKN
jgi:hypothetical protein